MRIISVKVLREFWENHEFRDSEETLKSWFDEAKIATWKTPNEIKEQYKNASILKDSRVVFNIHGNKYRLIVKINYPYSIVYIRFIDTHEEYDKINANEV